MNRVSEMLKKGNLSYNGYNFQNKNILIKILFRLLCKMAEPLVLPLNFLSNCCGYSKG